MKHPNAATMKRRCLLRQHMIAIVGAIHLSLICKALMIAPIADQKVPTMASARSPAAIDMPMMKRPIALAACTTVDDRFGSSSIGVTPAN
jgi:hypothetical protein